jgi:hypothetical protein
MAEVFVEDDKLVVRLSLLERAESAHSDVRVPRDEITKIEVLEHPVDAVGGWKLVGARLRGSFAIGTFVVDGRRVFAVVHRDTGRGLRITLSRGSFYELVIGCDDPEAVVASLTAS